MRCLGVMRSNQNRKSSSSASSKRILDTVQILPFRLKVFVRDRILFSDYSASTRTADKPGVVRSARRDNTLRRCRQSTRAKAGTAETVLPGVCHRPHGRKTARQLTRYLKSALGC